MTSTELGNAMTNDEKLELFDEWINANYDDLNYNFKEFLRDAD